MPFVTLFLVSIRTPATAFGPLQSASPVAARALIVNTICHYKILRHHTFNLRGCAGDHYSSFWPPLSRPQSWFLLSRSTIFALDTPTFTSFFSNIRANGIEQFSRLSMVKQIVSHVFPPTDSILGTAFDCPSFYCRYRLNAYMFHTRRFSLTLPNERSSRKHQYPPPLWVA